MELILVRHGESEANVAASAAEASGALRIAVPARDADVELSDRGRRQAEALGRRLATDPVPDAIRVSPSRRPPRPSGSAATCSSSAARRRPRVPSH